ncbi:tetratricopeptide repeat protein [Sedimenticola selenatireducens]|uniref:Tetratricopeptide repeat protein n=1 Tax=Sedimenticola selenatireducens TaxID=191960 RepID=A0A557SLX8_9GAMM|nr:tetratricopeptide repeat protein [Sedimenticola selenatireducens]TVO78436.1 tetratricopeptide repeat protein [Sedimenticola selenatireducens]TVT62705.1 MAG: tetratricopeptide repeat protein [Sedimenticola selenatireducens]
MSTRQIIKQLVTPLVITGMTILPYVLAEMVLANPTTQEDVSGLYKTLTFDIVESAEALEAQRFNGKKQVAYAAYRLAVIAASQGDKGKAFKLISESLMLQPENLSYLAYAADMAFNLKNFMVAERLLLKMISLEQNSNAEQNQALPTLLDDLALIYQKQNRLSDSVSLLTEVIALEQINKGDTPIPVLAQRLHRLVEMKMQLGNYGQALKHLDKIVTIYQANPVEHSQSLAKVFHNIGEIRSLMNDVTEAKIAYKKAIELWDMKTEQGKNGIDMTRKSLTRLKAVSMAPTQKGIDYFRQTADTPQDKTSSSTLNLNTESKNSC